MRINLYYVLLLLGVLTSCNSLQTYYQVCDVKSNLNVSSDGRYEYTDNSCSVYYDFWCNGGNPGFILTNNTNEIIYVELNKSFFIRNGIAYDYFLNRSVSTSAAFVESASASRSGTTYGYWNAIGGLVPGSLTASVGASTSSSKSSSVTTEEKSIIAIPPHTSKSFAEYAISQKCFYDCNQNITPSKKQSPSYDFQLINSPLTFSNYITYRIGDNPQEFTFINDFYVSTVTFYHEDAALIDKQVGCSYETEKIKVVKDANPKRFYVRYSSDIKAQEPKIRTNQNVKKLHDDLYGD